MEQKIPLLHQQVQEKKDALVKLRLNLGLGKEKDVSQIRKQRREIARLLTKISLLTINDHEEK